VRLYDYPRQANRSISILNKSNGGECVNCAWSKSRKNAVSFMAGNRLKLIQPIIVILIITILTAMILPTLLRAQNLVCEINCRSKWGE
jgi:hypothetical protein